MLGPTVRRTWAPRGCTPVIKVADPHGRISVIGALRLAPKWRRFSFYFQLSQDNANFHGGSVAAFVKALYSRIQCPMTVLWDEIRVHRAKPVRDYLAKHRRIVIEEFPPYAPELNPVDYVWAYVKYQRLPNYTPPNLSELRQRITVEFTRLQRRPDLLQSFYKHTGLGCDPVEIESDHAVNPQTRPSIPGQARLTRTERRTPVRTAAKTGIAESQKWQSNGVKQITIQQLHEETERWVEEAADNGGILITENGKPVATISQLGPVRQGKPLPNREAEIQKRTRLFVGSEVYISEMRDRA